MRNGLQGAPGFMAPSMRVAWRDRFGDFPALIDAARSEHEAGRVANAWLGYHLALHTWLSVQVDHRVPKNTANPLGETQSLAWRLTRRNVIDAWTAKMIERFLHRPKVIRLYHVDTLACFVTALSLEYGRADRKGVALER